MKDFFEKDIDIDAEREVGFNIARNTSFNSYFEYRKSLEKPAVKEWYGDGPAMPDGQLEGMSFELSNSPKAIYITKQRLAELLIAESKGELFIDTKEDRIKRGRLYTEKEFLEAEERAFNNAQLLVKHSSFDSNELEYEFKTIKDYRDCIERIKDRT